MDMEAQEYKVYILENLNRDYIVGIFSSKEKVENYLRNKLQLLDQEVELLLKSGTDTEQVCDATYYLTDRKIDELCEE